MDEKISVDSEKFLEQREEMIMSRDRFLDIHLRIAPPDDYFEEEGKKPVEQLKICVENAIVNNEIKNVNPLVLVSACVCLDKLKKGLMEFPCVEDFYILFGSTLKVETRISHDNGKTFYKG